MISNREARAAKRAAAAEKRKQEVERKRREREEEVKKQKEEQERQEKLKAELEEQRRKKEEERRWVFLAVMVWLIFFLFGTLCNCNICLFYGNGRTEIILYQDKHTKAIW